MASGEVAPFLGKGTGTERAPAASWPPGGDTLSAAMAPAFCSSFPRVSTSPHCTRSCEERRAGVAWTPVSVAWTPASVSPGLPRLCRLDSRVCRLDSRVFVFPLRPGKRQTLATRAHAAGLHTRKAPRRAGRRAPGPQGEPAAPQGSRALRARCFLVPSW